MKQLKYTKITYMSEKEKKVQIQLERHLWPDEVEALEKRKKEKRKNAFLTVLVITLISLSLFVGIFIGKSTNKNDFNQTTDPEFAKLETLYRRIKNNWYFKDQMEEEGGDLVSRAVKGMIGDDYDLHSSFLTADQTIAFTEGIDLGFVGIGVQYIMTDEGAYIERVFMDSPADKAGIKIGDYLVAINGESCLGWSSDDVVDKVRGEQGTTVNLTYLRDGKETSVDVGRDTVENSVYGELREDYGYLDIVQFSSVCGAECEKYLNYFKDNGVNKLIVDVRADGGGYLSAVLDVANLLLDKGQTILTQKYVDGSVIESKADGVKQIVFDKIVILGDENSASASEALIACLTQNGKAVFVGNTTYGKSTIQTPTYYSDGSTLKLTTGMWYTPDGYYINLKGIEPDYKVLYHDAFYYTDYYIDENSVYEFDEVGDGVHMAQLCLDYLGYEIDRYDGYFSSATLKAVKQYQKDFGYEVDGILTYDLVVDIVNSVSRKSVFSDDVQLLKAEQLLNE